MSVKQKQQPDRSTVTVHVPLMFVVRGGRKTIISEVPYTAPRTRFDDSITKALARAHRWRSLIENGTYASITELAKDKGVNDTYACRLLRLSLLAPDIIEAILDRRGTHLTLDTLVQSLPLEWDKQQTVLRASC
jgi:hypothetical protein